MFPSETLASSPAVLAFADSISRAVTSRCTGVIFVGQLRLGAFFSNSPKQASRSTRILSVKIQFTQPYISTGATQASPTNLVDRELRSPGKVPMLPKCKKGWLAFWMFASKACDAIILYPLSNNLTLELVILATKASLTLAWNKSWDKGWLLYSRNEAPCERSTKHKIYVAFGGYHYIFAVQWVHYCDKRQATVIGRAWASPTLTCWMQAVSVCMFVCNRTSYIKYVE